MCIYKKDSAFAESKLPFINWKYENKGQERSFKPEPKIYYLSYNFLFLQFHKPIHSIHKIIICFFYDEQEWFFYS